MTCKLSHDEDGLPKWLCRTCNPDKFKTTPPVRVEEAKPQGMSPEVRALRLRKLRKEEKTLSNLIDEIGPRDPVRRRKLYDAIKEVEREIDRVEKAA
jgi:hypothetical protein